MIYYDLQAKGLADAKTDRRQSKGGSNMFKVTKIEYTTKTFRIPNQLLRQLEAVAQRKHISLNQLIVQCCNYAIEQLDPAEMAAEEV